MKNLDLYPLRDTAIYNPHLLSKEELISTFCVRQKPLNRLLDSISDSRPDTVPQHHLVVAQRGMGKTTLLRRLQFAVDDDPELSRIWLPLAFPEEQYNVGKLSDLWLNTIDALSDTLERMDRGSEAEELDSRLEALVPLNENERATETLSLLVSTAERLERRLILLIDNIDLILVRISETQAWAVREVLSHEPTVLLVGASANALEVSYKYEKPFYDFFLVHNLGGLDLEETTELLKNYAERWKNEDALRIVENEPARIRTLHTLTGGNPRTLTLLYNILGHGLDGDVRSDLESLLDQCTPLYKSRVEALAPQRQQVVHALAVRWHPASAAQVASDLNIEVKAVSSQLVRLVREGLVEEVPFDPSTRKGFQIAERFFNIWYLMRATRRARRRLIWLVEFLKMFYSEKQLRSHALRHLEGECWQTGERLRHAEYSFALAEALQEPQIRWTLETSGLYTLIEDRRLRLRLSELVDLKGQTVEFQTRANFKKHLEELHESVLAMQPQGHDLSPEKLWDALAYRVAPIWETENLIKELSRADDDVLDKLLRDLEVESAFFSSLVGSERLSEALRKTFAEGLMMHPADNEGASAAAIRLAEPQITAFAISQELDRTEEVQPLLNALTLYLEKTDSTMILAKWAKHTSRVDPRSEHLSAILESFNLEDVQSVVALLDLSVAWMQLDCPQRVDMCASQISRLKISEAPLYWLEVITSAYHETVDELDKRGFSATSEVLQSKWLETLRLITKSRPESKGACFQLGAMLGYKGLLAEAEEVLRASVGLWPEESLPWSGLGKVLMELGREEAEDALRQALILNPLDGAASYTLAEYLFDQNGDLSEAEELARIASEATPGMEHFAALLFARILARSGKWREALEQMGRFLSHETGEFDSETLLTILVFLSEAAIAGKARDAADLLDRLGMADRWKPLREALETVATGRRDYLKRLAPEIRQPTEEILAFFESLSTEDIGVTP